MEASNRWKLIGLVSLPPEGLDGRETRLPFAGQNAGGVSQLLPCHRSLYSEDTAQPLRNRRGTRNGD